MRHDSHEDRVQTTAEPISPWDQLKQSFREGMERGKATAARKEALRREMQVQSIAGIRVRLNDIEHDLIELFQRKFKMDWDDSSQPDMEITALMDDWRSVREYLERRLQ